MAYASSFGGRLETFCLLHQRDFGTAAPVQYYFVTLRAGRWAGTSRDPATHDGQRRALHVSLMPTASGLEEREGRGRADDVVHPAPIGAALEVVEAEVVLEFAILPFDRPATARERDPVVDRRGRRQVQQVVFVDLGRRAFAERVQQAVDAPTRRLALSATTAARAEPSRKYARRRKGNCASPVVTGVANGIARRSTSAIDSRTCEPDKAVSRLLLRRFDYRLGTLARFAYGGRSSLGRSRPSSVKAFRRYPNEPPDDHRTALSIVMTEAIKAFPIARAEPRMELTSCGRFSVRPIPQQLVCPYFFW